MDLNHFMYPEALKILFELNGWKLTDPIVKEEVGIFKADFYPEGFVVAEGKHGKIYASGETKVLFKKTEYSSVSDLMLDDYLAFSQFKDWEFIEEKEWVISKKGEWLSSFSTLLQLPKASKFRC